MSNIINANLKSLLAGGQPSYVVGSYNSMGGLIEEGAPVEANKEMIKAADIYQKHIASNAEYNPDIIATAKKPGRKKKTPPYKPPADDHQALVTGANTAIAPFAQLQQQLDFEGMKVPKKRVTFSNSFGNIKVQVEDIMYTPLAIGLIFSCEDDIIFTPKPSETLTIDTGDGTRLVYYPDVLFSLPNSDKRIMILFTTSEETEEKYESAEPDTTD